MGKDWREDKDGAFRSVGAFRFAKTPRDLIAKTPRDLIAKAPRVPSVGITGRRSLLHLKNKKGQGKMKL